MKRLFIPVLVALAALSIAGCTAEEQRKELLLMRENLPAGCKVIVPGTYAQRDVLVVVCDGRPTSTTHRMVPSGKTSVRNTVMWIGPRIEKAPPAIRL